MSNYIPPSSPVIDSLNPTARARKFSPDVLETVKEIGHDIQSKIRNGKGTSKTQTIDGATLKAAVNDYCTNISEGWCDAWSFASQEQYDNSKDPIGQLAQDFPRPLHLGLYTAVQTVKDPIHYLNVCSQLSDLLAYCERCSGHPVLFMLEEDTTRTQIHQWEHERYSRGEAKRVGSILKSEDLHDHVCRECGHPCGH